MADPAAPERDWTIADGPGGAVRIAIRVPPRRKPWLAAWAVAVAAAYPLLVLMLAACLVAWAPGIGSPAARPILVLCGIGLVLVGPRIPGAFRLARWRLAGREEIVLGGGRLRVRRTACARSASADLDLAGGAFVGRVGDVDTFLVRASRWRTGRWFRRDDVPGLDVGAVRIATRDGSALVGLSLTAADAASLAEALASLPGLAPDRSPVPPPEAPRPTSA